MDICITDYSDKYLINLAEAEKTCFSEAWSENALKEFFSYNHNNALVALCDGIFAGYITYSVVFDEIQIANVATLPEFRRNNVGLSLVKRIISVAKEKNCKIVYLEVRSKNSAAINLYEKCGFIRSGFRKNFYTNPADDALLMNFKI